MLDDDAPLEYLTLPAPPSQGRGGSTSFATDDGMRLPDGYKALFARVRGMPKITASEFAQVSCYEPLTVFYDRPQTFAEMQRSCGFDFLATEL
jgi:hypothetical protein